MARLFVAVALPPEQRGQLANLCQDVSGARWGRPEQMHVTVRFLGFVATDGIAVVETALARVKMPAFGLGLHGVGTFGGPKRADVLWAGVQPQEPLTALKTAVDAALGPDPETGRPYLPHVTLARFKESPDSSLSRFVALHADLRGPQWTVSAFHLYESAPAGEGVQHRILRSFPLGSRPSGR